MQSDFSISVKDKTLTIQLEAVDGVDSLLLQTFHGCKVTFEYDPQADVLRGVLTLIGAY